MARKDRAPNPPKRPQAPQRRSTPADPASTVRQRRLLYMIAGSGILVLAVVLGIVFLSGGGKDERATLASAGCTLEVKPALKGEHDLQITATSDKWNTDPPTSGSHNDQPAVYGFYEDPVALAQTVHNLEHGGIVIHYGPKVPDAEMQELRDFYNDDPNGLVVAPLTKLGSKIALSAWTTEEAISDQTGDNGKGFLAICPSFDVDVVSSFLDEHRFQGPERFPPELLVPGS